MSKFFYTSVFIIVLSFNISANADHLKEGQVVSCEVIENAAQSFDPFRDRVYSNNESFKFRVVDINDEGGFLELSSKGEELMLKDYLKFEFHFPNQNSMKQLFFEF